jgi:hypothetical protein
MTNREHCGYDNAQLVLLCTTLLPSDPSLTAEVRLAIDQPAVYLATIQPQRRLQRTDADPPPDLPWTALLNGLLAREQLELLDWRADLPEVMAAIDTLLHDQPADAQRWTWVDQASWAQASTADFLDAVGQHLRAEQLVLACFPLDADMYPVAVIDAGLLPIVRKQAAQAGYGDVESFGSLDTAQEITGSNHGPR